MRVSLQQLSCVALLFGLRAQAFASDEYFTAFVQADAAERAGDLETAARVLASALRVYPQDYALALRLGWVQFQLRHYATAEYWYRIASEVSEGSPDALIGLGWSLSYQARCEDARRVLSRVRDASAVQSRVEEALAGCAAKVGASGSLWLQLSAAGYRDNPWKGRSGDVSGGATLLPNTWLQLGAAYRFLALDASDSRIAGYAQHEGYVQVGYAGSTFGALAHGAVISSAGGAISTSRHFGVSARWQLVGELLLESSASFYRDLWVARLAPAWRLTVGTFSITPGFALQRFAQATLGSLSLVLAYTSKLWSIWLSGKYGSEYRAAYLAQFAIFNSEDRSAWAASAGLRLRAGGCCAVFASYALNRLKSPDGLLSELHLLSVGTAFIL